MKLQCNIVAFSIWKRNVFPLTPLDLLFQKKGINKNNLCVYTPTNKIERSQPIASDILFSLLIGVLSLN